jgi:hypothetical protein
MSDAIVVRDVTTVDGAAEDQRLVGRVYAERAAIRPAGIRYRTLRLADGVTFIHVALRDSDDDPLVRVPALPISGRAGRPKSRAAQPGDPTIVGTYGF